MTQLVLDPVRLQLLFPAATASRTVRVRLLAQVVSYSVEDGHLLIRAHPAVIGEQDNAVVRIDVRPVINKLSLDHTEPGSCLDLTGYYDGWTVNVVECSLWSGCVSEK